MFKKKHSKVNLLAFLCFKFAKDVDTKDVELLQTTLQDKYLRRIVPRLDSCICEYSFFNGGISEFDSINCIIKKSKMLLSESENIKSFGFAFGDIPKNIEDVGKIKNEAKMAMDDDRITEKNIKSLQNKLL